MKAYGMTLAQYVNDSKKEGDLAYNFRRHSNPSFAKTGVQNVLRRYKKQARRVAKADVAARYADAE
jgi:hypothetical protein